MISGAGFQPFERITLSGNTGVQQQQRVKEQEQQIQQQSKLQHQAEAQDISRSSNQAVATATVAYTFVNGKATAVSGNQNKTNRTNDNNDGSSGKTNSKKSKNILASSGSDYHTSIFGYSRRADAHLTKGLSLNSVGRGIPIEEDDKDKKISQLNNETSYANEGKTNSELADELVWVSSDLFEAYPNKISVNNQDKAYRNELSSINSLAALNGYAATTEYMADAFPPAA